MRPTVPMIATTLLGFSMAVIPQQAKGTLLTTTTSVVGTVTVAAIVVVIYLIVKKVDGGESRTRVMLDAGALAVRGDLATELALIAQSPRSYEQLSNEIARGSGPSLDALVRATGVSADDLAKHWRAASDRAPVADSEGAVRLTAEFMDRIAPQVSVDPELYSTLLWQLQRERLDPSFPASAPAHAWLARWLGVPVSGVAEATALALSDLDARPEAEQRSALSERSSDYLDRIAAYVDAHHEAEITAKIAELVAEAEPWLPAHLSPALAALRGA